MSTEQRIRFAAVCSDCGEQLTMTHHARDHARTYASAHESGCCAGAQLAVKDVVEGDCE